MKYFQTFLFIGSKRNCKLLPQTQINKTLKFNPSDLIVSNIKDIAKIFVIIKSDFVARIQFLFINRRRSKL